MLLYGKSVTWTNKLISLQDPSTECVEFARDISIVIYASLWLTLTDA